MSKRYTVDGSYWTMIDAVVFEYKDSKECTRPKSERSCYALDRIATSNSLSRKLDNSAPTDSYAVECITITDNEKYGLISIIEYLNRDDTSELLKYLKELKPNEE